MKLIIKLLLILGLGICIIYAFKSEEKTNILSHTVDLKKQNLKLYWKNDKGEILKSFKNLNNHIKSKKETLVFAMNGGMYMKNRTSLGLFIENGVTKKKINKVKEAFGNFYMQPNGIFYITDSNQGFVCQTDSFVNKNIKYATQSGPMLVIDGKMHPKVKKGSKNLNNRNGVGIIPNNKLVFAMSKEKINFYNFATYFKSLGCKNALYLDGYVSRTYLPKKGFNYLGGNFGVIIGETKKSK